MTIKNILIVDDEPLLIQSLAFILKKAGYTVESAADGDEALIKVDQIKPDLIFLDIMMPRKNGYEVCQIIRQNPAYQDIYIIMLSAKGWDVDKAKAISVGANEFMSKPYSPLEVVKRVNKLAEDAV
jgi:DNA-binding response OmpR family regulator